MRHSAGHAGTCGKLDPVIEVSLGGLTGLFVSFVLRSPPPRRSRAWLKPFPNLVAGFDHGLGDAEAHRIQDGIGQQLASSVAAEAERERPLRLASDPLTEPLSRTLLRLRLGTSERSALPSPSTRALLQPLQSGELLKRATRRPGSEDAVARELSGHSMRIGAAQDMMVGGFDALAIMQAGGWKSANVVLR